MRLLRQVITERSGQNLPHKVLQIGDVHIHQELIAQILTQMFTCPSNYAIILMQMEIVMRKQENRRLFKQHQCRCSRVL